MDVDLRDRIILDHAPLVAMPRYTNFAPLEQTGCRYIVAEDGLWREIKRPWLRLTQLIAEADVPLPYGLYTDDHNGIDFEFPDEDLAAIVTRFVADAREVLPNEHAAWGVWDEQKQLLTYRPLVAIAAGPGGISFHRPRLAAHEHLAVDIHSHGCMGAFFSATDDDDDRGELKLSIVIGNLDADEASMRMRLCALGQFLIFDREPV